MRDSPPPMAPVTAVPIPRMKTRACLALAEETEAARVALYSLLGAFPPEAFTTGDVETEDNVRGVLCHVTFALRSHACWVARVLGRLDPEEESREKAAFLAHVRAQADAAGFEEASRQAAGRHYAVVATVTEEDLAREFRSNWGVTFAVEAMLEHAVVHLLRHKRQLEIHLGRRPDRFVPAAP